jgi:hypothetical protein
VKNADSPNPCHPEPFFWAKDLAVDFAVGVAVVVAFYGKRRATPKPTPTTRSFAQKKGSG